MKQYAITKQVAPVRSDLDGEEARRITQHMSQAVERMVTHALCPRMRPKFQLREDLEYLTPGFRKEYNAWLKEWFGEEPVVYYAPERDLFMVSPSTLSDVSTLIANFGLRAGK